FRARRRQPTLLPYTTLFRSDLICLRDGDGEPAHETYGSINVTRVRLKRYRGSKLDYVGRYAAFIMTSFFYLASRSLTRRYDLVRSEEHTSELQPLAYLVCRL